MAVPGRVVYVAGIPLTAVAKELVDYLEGAVGEGTVYSVQIKTRGTNWMSKGYGFVEFVDEEAACKAYVLAKQGCLFFQNNRLKVDTAKRAVKASAMHKLTKLRDGHLSMGYLMGEEAFHTLWSTGNVSTDFDPVAKKLSFLFLIQNINYKMELHYKNFYKIRTCTPLGTPFKSLLFKLYFPPQVYLRREIPAGDIMELCEQSDFMFSMTDRFKFCKDDQEPPWIRTTDFTENKSIGHSLVYCLDLHDVSKESVNTFVKELADFGLISNPPIFEKIKLQSGDSYSSSQELVPLLRSFHVNSLPFELVFQLNNLVQVGLLNEADISPQFCELLNPSHTPLEHVNLILRAFAKAPDTIYNPMKLLKSKLDYYKNSKRSLKSAVIKLDDGQMLGHRLLITPTKVYCMGPEIDVSNRVTRHFASEIDNFLRISFVEEDWDRIASTMLSVPFTGGNTDTSNVYHRILRVLQHGVKLGGKKFEFLAFSASQLREQSVWMFASNRSVTAQSIRSWMGDFLSIRNVAKCAARMGQSFSSSTHTMNVSSYEICHIPDIEIECGRIKYCFSDGIGKISKAFAMEVAAKCGLQKLRFKVPSAFQIRYGGYKGVVAVDPSSFAKLSLRPSMCKFPSTHTGLDVLSWTHFIPCYLNRQVINLLSTLGVNDHVFERKQRDVVEQLDQMLHDPVVALEVLQIAFAGERHKTMVQMLHSGYHPHSEPYLNSLLQVFRASQLLMLRTKSRILVPKGRCLMGCLDETGILGYGEVFVQVSPTPGTRRFLKDGLDAPRDECGVGGQESACIVLGHIVVAKNPCLHPGDVRILRAVDVPSLQHMVDCIVFPQRGPRPHPNECSGSDLDGDLYFVSWDQELIPPSTDPPMDYNPPSAIQLDHSVTIEEIEEFFLNHMMNDSLGLIANAHTVHADAEPDKARNQKCIELAKLFSIAVDFPKTGIPALVPVNLRPKVYPDFMEKQDKPSYASNAILGKLFRSIRKAAEVDLPIVLFSEKDVCNAYDKHLLVEGFEQFVDEALMHKSWYDAKLTSLMNQYGIQQEAELLSGNILQLSRYYCKRQGDVKERIMYAVNALEKEARNWFEGGDQDITYTDQEEYAKASAWYHVTYHPHFRKYFQKEFQENELNTNLLSFPWVLCDKLLAIRKGSVQAPMSS